MFEGLLNSEKIVTKKTYFEFEIEIIARVFSKICFIVGSFLKVSNFANVSLKLADMVLETTPSHIFSY